MRRRTFSTWLLSTTLACLGPIGRLARAASPARAAHALRARLFTGKVRPLDRSSIAKPGRWKG